MRSLGMRDTNPSSAENASAGTNARASQTRLIPRLCMRPADQTLDFTRRRGERRDSEPQDVICDAHVQFTHRVRDLSVGARGHPVHVAGEDRYQAIVLMYIRFGMLVYVEEAAMVEQRAVAFANRSQPR